METDEARGLSLELLETAEAAIVSTIDGEGYPQTRAMFNLRRKAQFPGLAGFFAEQREDFTLFFTTNTSSEKIEQIRRNPRVAVYYHKPEEFRGLMLGGVIEMIRDERVLKAIWQPEWKRYYPGGHQDPDHIVLRLNPRIARYYHRLQSCQFIPGSGT